VKRSAHVARAGLAVALAASLAGCTDAPDEYEEQTTAYGQVCMKWNRATGEYDVRVPDSECDQDGDHSHFNWIYIHSAGGHSAPAIGSKVKPGSYVTTLPAGATVAKPPATGGFGTFRAPVGS